MAEFSHDVIDSRIPEELGSDIGTSVNAMLDTIAAAYKIAERRGKEWERAVDAMDDVVCVLDSRGRIVRANRALAARIGVDVRHVRGMELESILYPDRRAAKREPIAMTRKTERPASGALAECPLGKNLDIITAPVRRDYGESMTCVVVRDSADEVGHTSRMYRMGRMVEKLNLPVVMADPFNGRVIFGNAAFLDAFGYDAVSAKGLNLDNLVGEDDETTRLALRAAAHDEQGAGVPLQLARAGGAALDVRANGSVFRSASGGSDAMLLVMNVVDAAPVTDEVQSPSVEACEAGPGQELESRDPPVSIVPSEAAPEHVVTADAV